MEIMIIHKYDDGGEGYQYEVGDRVIVTSPIHDSCFTHAAMETEKCVVEKIQKSEHWITAIYEIRWSKDWGLIWCHKWGLKPHSETMAMATVFNVPNA
jgi:hypothetical protein